MADETIIVEFVNENKETLNDAPLLLPVSATNAQLQALVNQLLENEDPVPIDFRTEDGTNIESSIIESIEKDKLNTEIGIKLIYFPQAVFKVNPVTRCTSTLPGHGEPVISVQFSPDGRNLASGSGDKTVRMWDVLTEMPKYTLTTHKHWVLCISWSPNGKKLASACKNGQICLWNPVDGKQIGPTLNGHKQWVTSLSWQPAHQDPESRLLASSGKDGSIRIWDTILFQTVRVLSGHTASVTCVKWGGEGLIYSASQDRTIKVWRATDGILCKTLTGHAHWVNTLALNTDYVLRTGAFDLKNDCLSIPEDQVKEKALERYNAAKGIEHEKLVSGSDDFTMFLWEPFDNKKPIGRMTGHQQLVNQVLFSPDSRYIASASFDKSIKIWDGKTGKYVTSLRGHVQAVYQISWSADSRLLVSGSADSTLKVWNMKNKGLMIDLPGHGSDVFAVDWSPDGERVASGGKDKVLKIWRQ
uniref:WD_REPEATS_REGION domain-containing protein n=1 Tax=Parastrongyloides trichosuri TaxID=131310 RepID=A0A0N4ZI08_PARTI